MRPVKSPYRSSLACAACTTSDGAILLPAAPAFRALPGTLMLASACLLATSFVDSVLISARATASDVVSSSILA